MRTITILIAFSFFLHGCTTIKVVEKKIEMPIFEHQCRELDLLSGTTFKDALETITNNEAIHQECILLAESQNKFIQKLAK